MGTPSLNSLTSDRSSSSRKLGSSLHSAPIALWRWLLYLIYGLFIVAIFLYFRFPTQQFKAFCTELTKQYFPGHETTIGSLHYKFPLTLAAGNLQLQSADKAGKAPISIQQFTITPDLKAPGKNFTVSVTAYGGTHQAILALDHSHNAFTLQKIEINELDLTKLSWIQAQTGRVITGLFTAQGNYSGQTGQDISKGTGQGAAHIKNGTIELLYPILSLKNIALDKGETLFKLENQKLFLTQGKFSGKELEGTISGQISTLSSPIAAMQFDLKGTLTPSPALIKKSGQDQPMLLQRQQNHAALPFQLKGTIGKPAFLFDS